MEEADFVRIGRKRWGLVGWGRYWEWLLMGDSAKYMYSGRLFLLQLSIHKDCGTMHR